MNGEAGPKAGPDPLPAETTPDPEHVNLKRERACRAANVAGLLVTSRYPLRSARERLEALRAAGRVHDEHWFASRPAA